jgi:hypothetical protein
MIKDEKGELQDHMVSGELAAYLGINKQQVKRLSDHFPPSARTSKGWGLWSPAQQQAMMARVLGRRS